MIKFSKIKQQTKVECKNKCGGYRRDGSAYCQKCSNKHKNK